MTLVHTLFHHEIYDDLSRVQLAIFEGLLKDGFLLDVKEQEGLCWSVEVAFSYQIFHVLRRRTRVAADIPFKS